jgi:hypothetical protein
MQNFGQDSVDNITTIARMNADRRLTKDLAISLYLEADRLLCELADDLQNGQFYGQSVTPGQAVDQDDFYHAAHEACETAGVEMTDEVWDYLQNTFIQSGRLDDINNEATQSA